MQHQDTKLIHLGRESSKKIQSVNPPLVRASTTTFPDLASFKSSYQGITFETARYGRSGTETTFELQSTIADICAAESCIATSCGLSACTAVLSTYAKLGGEILIQKDCYQPSINFALNVLIEYGVKVSLFDDIAELNQLITRKTKLIFIEVPTSLTMKLIDVKAVASIAKRYNVPVACDSTWGSPLFFDAHKLGVTISIHSATKFINGHSDVMLGAITGSYTDLSDIRQWCEKNGSYAAPDSCWMALRGLRTLSIRMHQHQRNARYIAHWLNKHPFIVRVAFPALTSDPYHSLWKKQFTGAAGPFTIELKTCSEAAFTHFINSLKLFGLGTSWGGFESLIMPAIPHHERSKDKLPDKSRLVRLHIGLEHKKDLRDDLAQALEKLKT